MESLKSIYDLVKSDFCNLLDYKLHGNTIEIITGIPTINQSMVSVFVSWDGEKYVASDGGWIDEDVYESDEQADMDIFQHAVQQYIDYYCIKTTYNNRKTLLYYKTCYDTNIISSIVHDVGNFIALYINLNNTKLREPIEDLIKQKQFQTDINKTLRRAYGIKNVYTNQLVDVRDNRRIRLNAIVNARQNHNLVNYCLMYITGSRNDQLVKDLTKATINFKVLGESKSVYLNYRRIAVINAQSLTRRNNSTDIYLEELIEYTDSKPIIVEKDGALKALSEIIPLPMIGTRG